MPERVQRKRTKGWRLPQNATIVTRPTEWGNPYRIILGTDANTGRKVFFVEREGDGTTRMYDDKTAAAKGAVTLFRLWATAPAQEKWRSRAKLFLRGRDLCCTCALDQPWCHADVLLEIANS